MIKNIFNMIKLVLVDLSGTLHVENVAIFGAVEALDRLRESNVKIKFVTNTTKESQRILHERLNKLGFTLGESDIYSSLAAARRIIIQRDLKPMLILSEEAMEDFQGLDCNFNDKPNAVVIGLAPDEFYYDKLNKAFRCLLDGAQLIAIHAGKYYKRSDGLALGPGCFVKGLEYSAQCTAELVGKPNKSFFVSALDDILPEETIMIGDDVLDDIQGALDAGIRGILVKTGKYRAGDENKTSPAPCTVVPSFVEAVDKILEEIENSKTCQCKKN